jgi:hypothetical protein
MYWAQGQIEKYLIGSSRRLAAPQRFGGYQWQSTTLASQARFHHDRSEQTTAIFIKTRIRNEKTL